MAETLHVFWNEDPVGLLTTTENGEMHFQYSDRWLSREDAMPVSAQLPLLKTPLTDKSVSSYFGNLLPEGRARSLIARRLGISETNDFALLKALGSDCAGALSLWPDETPAPRSSHYEPLNPEILDSMIDHMETVPLMTPAEDLRLSLAGAQEKIALMIEGAQFFIPKGSAASSHILKPENPQYPGVVVNETFCMKLAKAVGLPVAEVFIWRNRHTALVVERYDRRKSESGTWRRMHQEDFCQALGVPYGRKYETEGGPGLGSAFALLNKHSTQPIADKQTLIQGVVFNACIGNMDAHAKNFSMLIHDRTYRLAPFYDLLSTQIYGALSPKMAMRIGGQIRAEWLTRTHWEQLAVEAGVGHRAVLNTVQELLEKIPSSCQEARDRVQPLAAEQETLDKLIRHISTTCQTLQRGLEKHS